MGYALGMPSLGSATGPTWRSHKLTARAKKAARLAEEEARRLKSSRIGSEHLFLGLIREGEGVAAKVLKHHGLELEAARDAVAKADTSDPAVPVGAGIDC